MPADWISLGGAIAKAVAKVWLPEQPTAHAIGSALIDYVDSSVTDRRQARAVSRHLERVGDRIAAELEEYFNLEFSDPSNRYARGLPANEQAAAINGVIDALALVSIDYDALVASNFDDELLARQLCASKPRLGLSEAGGYLFGLLAKECAVYVIGATMAMPDFNARVAVTLLRREAEAFAAVDDAISAIPKDVASRLGAEDSQRFELDYRRNVVRQLDRLALYGVDDERMQAPYPLTVAYLELTVAGSDSITSDRPSVRVDHALSDGKRFIITGDAGSGKTTVLQWLAVQACRRAFDGPIHHWKDLVPFFIRLRAYAAAPLPPPSAFLDTISPVLADRLPSGWVTARLKTGRALVLVDGLDELHADRRSDTIAWLDEMCTTYPDATYILTSRPPALSSLRVPADLSFAQRTLEPMSGPDVLAFVANWHRAAAHTVADPEAAQANVALESRMATAIRDIPTLRALASNPLLCALLCALNRARNGLVPHARIEVYATALNMLLRRRDAQRGISTTAKSPEESESLQLLQDLAYWMLRNDQAQVGRDSAVERIRGRLVSMPHARLNAKEAVAFLLDRTGVLREPAEGQLDFVHLSFQEYLAAGEIVAQDDVGALVERVKRHQWLDVAVNVAALASPRQREAIIQPLVGDGIDQLLHLTALACLGVSTSLHPELVAKVADRARQMLPPKSPEQARGLAAAGPIALKFLSAVENTTVDDATARATVRAIASVGGDDALGALSAWRMDRRPGVQQELVDAWPSFALEHYVDVVLADMRPDPATALVLTVGPAQMQYLGRLPWAERVVYEASGSDIELPGCIEGVTDLTVRSAGSIALHGLTTASALRILRIEHCAELASLSAQARFPNLRELHLNDLPVLATVLPSRASPGLVFLGMKQLPTLTAIEAQAWAQLEAIEITQCAQLTAVTSIQPLHSVRSVRLENVGLQDLTTMPSMPNLEQFDVKRAARLRSLDGLDQSPELTSIGIVECWSLTDLSVLSGLRSVSRLVVVDCSSVENIQPLAAMPSLREVDLRGCIAIRSLAPLRELRGLERLSLAGCWFALDCAGLDFIPEIEFPRPL